MIPKDGQRLDDRAPQVDKGDKQTSIGVGSKIEKGKVKKEKEPVPVIKKKKTK